MTHQSRREFLRLLALGVASSTLDVDRLLWVPGKKTIFIPETPKIFPVSFQEMMHILSTIVPQRNSSNELRGRWFLPNEKGKMDYSLYYDNWKHIVDGEYREPR